MSSSSPTSSSYAPVLRLSSSRAILYCPPVGLPRRVPARPRLRLCQAAPDLLSAAPCPAPWAPALHVSRARPSRCLPSAAGRLRLRLPHHARPRSPTAGCACPCPPARRLRSVSVRLRWPTQLPRPGAPRPRLKDVVGTATTVLPADIKAVTRAGRVQGFDGCRRRPRSAADICSSSSFAGSWKAKGWRSLCLLSSSSLCIHPADLGCSNGDVHKGLQQQRRPQGVAATATNRGRNNDNGIGDATTTILTRVVVATWTRGCTSNDVDTRLW